MRLISELRRRNVLRMAALYLLSAWLIMQVAEVVITLGRLPAWLGPVVLAVLIIGFPIALVVSWFYELTPEGLSLEKDVTPDESITHITGRRMDFIVIAMLLAVLIIFAYDKWGTAEPPELSLAVLPFEIVGDAGDGRSDLLALGIQDDLITRLSKVAALKVISRKSAARYGQTVKDMKTIGRELGARMILTGGVQRSNEQIRVNVQFVDAGTDSNVWAETYDRTLTATDVFDIQSQIVDAIVRELNAKLTPQETRQLDTMPTANLEAYTAYLRGKANANIESVESLFAAVEDFKTAIELDPEFALAHVGLADAYLTLGGSFYGGLSVQDGSALAEPQLARALALDASLGEAHASLGLLRQIQGDDEAAEAAYAKAIALRPSYSRVFRLYGVLRWRQGMQQEAMELLQQALRLDPYSASVNFDLGRMYDALGQFDKALQNYLRAVEVEPDHAFAYVYIAAIHYLVHGRLDEALVWYHKAAVNDAMSPSLQVAQAIPYLDLGDPESAKFWIDKGLELGPDTFWARYASLLHSVYTGDDETMQRDIEVILESYPGNWVALNRLGSADIVASRYEVARSRYYRVFPGFAGPGPPVVDMNNYANAIDLAYVLKKLGENERAEALLDASLGVIATLPRLGVGGYYISDVRVYAVRNQNDRALAALQAAIDSGWRFLAWYHWEFDATLESLRNEPEFLRLYDRVQADLAEQSRRVRDLRESGDISLAARLEAPGR